MSFYKKLKDNIDTDFSNENFYIEEQYQKMFKKIARDFVHRDDLKLILLEILEELNVESFSNDINFNQRQNALITAREYYENLRRPIAKRNTYKDVDEIDWLYGVDDEQ